MNHPIVDNEEPTGFSQDGRVILGETFTCPGCGDPEIRKALNQLRCKSCAKLHQLEVKMRKRDKRLGCTGRQKLRVAGLPYWLKPDFMWKLRAGEN